VIKDLPVKREENGDEEKKQRRKTGKRHSQRENYVATLKNDGDLCLSPWNDVRNMLKGKPQISKHNSNDFILYKRQHSLVQINALKGQRGYIVTTKHPELGMVYFLLPNFM
jgi:hypothetical protein